MLDYTKGKVITFLVLTSVVSNRFSFAFDLNLTQSCNNEQSQSCVLSDIKASYMNKFVIKNSTQLELQELIIRDDILLRRFPREIFEQAPNLQTFYIYNCGLNRINSFDFHHASKLQILFLQNNRLSEIPAEVFFGVPLLRELNLGQNHIHLVHKSAFVGLTNLTQLNLQQNAIQQLGENLFSPLNNLEYLDLSFNSISKIDSSTFADNTKLTTLLLNNNRFVVFEPNSLEYLLHLNTLDISNSFLAELNIISVDTLYAQNSSLKRCNIKGSVIKLNAGNNELRTLNVNDKTSVRELILHGNQFESLNDFVDMINLQHLDLSKNHISTLANSRSPLLLPLPSLTYLNLAFNKLKTLKIENFLLLKSLTHLDVAFNHLNNLEAEIFESLDKLEKIFIDGNGLHAFNFKKFTEDHPLVKEVGLSANGFDAGHMRKMIGDLQESSVELARHYPNIMGQILSSATNPSPFQQHETKFASNEIASHTDICQCFTSNGDILAYVTLILVTVILFFQIFRFLRDEKCTLFCWRRRSTFRLGQQWQTEPLDESISEV